MQQSSTFPKATFLIFVLGILCAAGCQQKSVLDASAQLAPTPKPVRPVPTPLPLKVGKAAPADASQAKDFELTMLDTSKRPLSQVLGQGKIVVVNFWATWCGPCRREIPDLIALKKEYQGKDVEIVGLSIEDPQQFQELVKGFAKQYEINYQVGYSSMEMFMLFNGTDPRRGIPQTFIFGKDGKLLQHIRGLRPAFKDYVREVIEEALTAA